MTLLDAASLHGGFDIAALLADASSRPEQEKASRSALLKDRQRLKDASSSLHAGLVEQVLYALCEGIEHPSSGALQEMRENFLALNSCRVRVLLLTIKNRPVFTPRPVPFDALDTDLIGMLRTKLRG